MPCPTSPAGGKVSANGVFSRGPQTTGRVGETANACELGGLLEKSYHESRSLLIIYCWLAFLLLRECFHTPSHFIPTYMRGFPRLNTWASAAQEDADTDSDPPAACLCQGPVLGGFTCCLMYSSPRPCTKAFIIPHAQRVWALAQAFLIEICFALKA